MQAETRSNDLPVLWLLLVPAGLIAIGLYGAGAAWVAVGTFGTALIVAAVIAPEIGFYAYFAWQALDPIWITEGTPLTPSKVLGPFLLLNYLLGLWRVGTPMLVSRRFVMIMFAFGFMGLPIVPFALAPLVALRYAGQIIVQVLLVVVAIHTLRTRAMIGRALFSTVVGGVVAATIMLVGGGQSGAFRRATLGEHANPNTTALALSIALMCIPAAWACHKDKLTRLFYLVAGPTILAATMQTGSRAALAAILLSAVSGGLLARGSGFGKRAVVPALCVLLAVTTGAYVLRTSILDPVSQERIEGFIRQRGSLEGESRLYIWDLALRSYVREPWGFGFGNTQFKLAEEHGMEVDVHSAYLSALVDGGPIGLGLFVFGLWELALCVARIRQANPGIPAAMLACFVGVSCLTHTIHFTKWFWIPATLCLLLAELTQRERRQTLNSEFGILNPSFG